MGWSFPPTEKAVLMEIDSQTYHRQMICGATRMPASIFVGYNGVKPMKLLTKE